MTLLKKKNQTSRGRKSHAVRHQSSVSDNVVRGAKLQFLKIARLTIHPHCDLFCVTDLFTISSEALSICSRMRLNRANPLFPNCLCISFLLENEMTLIFAS